MMRFAAPGGFVWLAFHEIRLAWRNRPRKGFARWAGFVLVALYIAFGCITAWGLRDQPITASAALMTAVLAGSVVAVSFMTAQAMIGSQRTLYESGDLALLFTAPVEPRAVLLAKLLGIAGTIMLTYAALLLPLVLPVAILGHPQLLGLILLLAALALVAAALGLAITLALATFVHPRAARTVGQVLAALLGGAVFLISQIIGHSGKRESSVMLLFERLRADGFGSTGLSDLPGRAAFGDPLTLLTLCGVGVALFTAVGVTLQHVFLNGYQDGGARLSRSRPTGRAMGRLFHAGLFRSVFAKEWRLLARDPALAFQIVLRLIYMAPIVLIAFGHDRAVPVAPVLAFASVLLASQLVGSFAWLTVSAEDAPELIAVAPVEKGEVDFVKLLTAFAMAAPLGVILPIAIALQTPLGAVIALVMTVIGGGLAGLAELKLGKPGQRQSFARRRGGSMVAGILSILIAFVFGGAAAVAVYWLS